MYRKFEQRLSSLINSGNEGLLRGGLIGLEKESLRVSSEGSIAQTAHPTVLGAALAHPYITTDYSEALLELITPPLVPSSKVLSFLGDVHKFVYDNLEDELLWAASMPCVLQGSKAIPIAQYGDSNLGQMKTVYRRGLGHRYGRVMQVISGVHFNYSVPDAFWSVYQEMEGDRQSSSDFISHAYFSMIRNLQRYGWLMPYLFGASPAVCQSFLCGKKTTLEAFDETTYYYPYATSLRMGDIGYQNSKELATGIKADYGSLDAYVDSLTRAINTPCPAYAELGVVVNDRYEQLNANILQIENEYYSSVRPKQIGEGNEKPTLSLKRRGVRYVELRSLDVNVFHPLGVDENQLLFLEAFLLFCLLMDSPPISVYQQREIDCNQGGVAHRGRDPKLFLQRNGGELPLRTWGLELLQAMEPVCEILDADNTGKPYTRALKQQQEVLVIPDLAPSARMLSEMKSQGGGFFSFARQMSLQHQDYFAEQHLSQDKREFFQQEAADSRQRQIQIEDSDSIPFSKFLQNYFTQSEE